MLDKEGQSLTSCRFTTAILVLLLLKDWKDQEGPDLAVVSSQVNAEFTISYFHAIAATVLLLKDTY
jgi:hypothetical protein